MYSNAANTAVSFTPVQSSVTVGSQFDVVFNINIGGLIRCAVHLLILRTITIPTFITTNSQMLLKCLYLLFKYNLILIYW